MDDDGRDEGMGQGRLSTSKLNSSGQIDAFKGRRSREGVGRVV